MSMQVGAAVRARVEHRTSLPEHLPHDGLAPGDRCLHQLLLQHLRLLQHGLQVPRDDEKTLLQKPEDHREVEEKGKKRRDNDCQCCSLHCELGGSNHLRPINIFSVLSHVGVSLVIDGVSLPQI